MSTRNWLLAGMGLVLALTPVSGVVAKEKRKQPAATEQTAPAQQSPTLDPHNASDLNEILQQADAAHYPQDGAPADYKKAFELYSLAEEVDDPTALNQLGLMYDFGDYVAIDDKRAVDYYTRAANLGSTVAKNNLALMYQAGEGVAKDPVQAVKWFHEAADEGYGYAMYQLGNMYFDGSGVERDGEEAVAWYQKAVNANEPNAHWSLALAYLYGDGGIGKDTQKAAELTYYALTHGVEATLAQLKRIGTAQTSPNFRRSLQQLLAQDGFYTGKIDGSFGGKTMDAVQAAYNTAQ